jgi:S1-C subfamily serine protease
MSCCFLSGDLFIRVSELSRGDVILEIDRQPIRDLSDYEKAVAAAKDKNLLFLVRRGDANIFLALK